MGCIDRRPRRRVGAFAALVLAAGVAPQTVVAAGCCGCVAAAHAATQGVIGSAETAIIARIQVAETQISQAIGSAAEKISYTIRDQTTAQQQMINGATARITEQLNRLASYEASETVARAYGRAQQSACVDANAANSVVAGGEGEDSADASRDAGIGAWMRNGDSLSSKVVSGAEIAPEDLDVSNLLMDPNGGSDAEAKDQLVQRLIDYTPPEPLPSKQRSTPQGVVYQSKLNERRMRLEPAIAVLRERAARTDPTYPTEGWFEPLLEQTGYGSTPEGKAARAAAAENDGKVSYDLRQRLQVRARSLGSVGYMQRVEGLQGDALTRELIKQVAIGNQLVYDRLKLAQRTAIIGASETARRVDQTNSAALDALRVNSVVEPEQPASDDEGSSEDEG